MAERVYPLRCAWCGKVMGYTEVERSSGCCDDCLEKYFGSEILRKVKDHRASQSKTSR